MPDRLPSAREWSDGLLLSSPVHRSISEDQQKLTSELSLRINFCIFQRLHVWRLQDKYQNYTKTEICDALLELCPPDSAMLLKSHQDRESRAQNSMLSKMCPGTCPFRA